MEITLKNINKFGFVFHSYDFNKILKETDEETMESLSQYISNLIKIPKENLYGDIDIINKGESIKLHYHILFGSFQVVVWVPDYKFKGRYFLHGSINNIKKYKPEKGVMCFMKPNDPNFIHGVSELLSDYPVKSYGFSSSVIPLPEKNDIFI